jgi:uncharacterized protein Yka (UPF0111/DUF47 family)
VAFRFRPVDATFYDLFAESAQHLVVGASLLAEMMADGTERAAIAQRMREAEHACDETTHAIVRRVNSTFVTPFDREDIYNLASGLDDVMDMMDEAVDLILLYEVEHLPGELSNQVEVLVKLPTAESLGEVQSLLDRAFAEETDAWVLGPDGEWARHHGEVHLQEALIEAQRSRRG